MLKLVSEIHTRQGAVIFSHAFRAQLYLRPTRYRFPPRFYMLKCFLPCELIVPPWKWTCFLTSPPSVRSAEMSWNVIKQSFIFRLNEEFNQPRPQYALRTIDHTTLSVGQYPLVVLNKFRRTSARSAEVVLTIVPILLTKFVLNQVPIKRLWRSASDPGCAEFFA